VKFFTIISFFILSVSPVLSEENIKNSIESDEIEYILLGVSALIFIEEG